VLDYNNNIKENFKKYNFGQSAKIDCRTDRNSKISGTIISKFNSGLTNILTNDFYVISSAEEWKILIQ